MDTLSNLTSELCNSHSCGAETFNTEPSRTEVFCSTDSEDVDEDPRHVIQKGERKDTSAELVASRMADGSKLRLAMALIDGLSAT